MFCVKLVLCFHPLCFLICKQEVEEAADEQRLPASSKKAVEEAER